MNKFLERCIGEWESFRIYIYPNTNKIVSIQSVMIIESENIDEIEITWKSYYLNTLDEYSKGNMKLKFDVNDNVIYRDKGYFTEEPTESKILELTSNRLVTTTNYDNKTYKEEIDIYNIGEDTYRRRFTRAYDSTGKVLLVGNYLEKKL